MPAAIESDRIRLQQVLANLVANALKFTKQGAVRVALDWEPGAAAGRGTLVASVADTGPGVAPELLDAIFEPFVQGDASIRRSHGGTGLGLAISRQLVELLGGTIELTTEIEVGSTFTVRVPAAVADPRAATPFADAHDRANGNGHAPDAAGAALDGLRILLVEDNDINRRVATAMLRRSGVDVHGAVDGNEAVSLAGESQFDLVLMDLQMPGLDGIEATRRIRAGERASGARRLPIVAMTGNALEDYGDACAAAGMDAFVTKPVTADQLRGVVARIVSRA